MKVFDKKVHLDELIHILKDGGLLILPSDTVYGLVADATNEQAVKKLLHFKNRPIGKPISVFVANETMLQEQVEVAEDKKKILKQLLPGPFTVALQSKHKVCRLLESERGTLGVRIPDYSFINELVTRYGKPLTATSANIGGRPPHYRIDSLLNELPQQKKELIDAVVDAGQLARNKPSTVIDMSLPEVKIVRRGDIIWKNEKTFVSESEAQTKKIAQFILNKSVGTIISKPVVLVLEGDLGTGKTVFVKGLAESMGITNIISPTYVIYYEYEVKNSAVKKLYHFDLYQIEETSEFEHLGLKNMLVPGSLLCLEWGEKSGEIFDMLRQHAEIVYVKLEYIDEKSRSVTFNY